MHHPSFSAPTDESIALLEREHAVEASTGRRPAVGARRLRAVHGLVDELDEVRRRVQRGDAGALEELASVTCRLRQAAAFASGGAGDATVRDLARVARDETARRTAFTALVVRAGGHLYVLPATDVERELPLDELGPEEGIRPIRMERCFSAADEWILEGGTALVLRGEPGAAPQRALVVDEVLGRQDVTVDALGLGASPVRGVRGGVSLDDERVALAIEPDALWID